MKKVMQTIRYFLEHLDELILQQIDPVKKANYFGMIFNTMPSYADLDFETHEKHPH